MYKMIPKKWKHLCDLYNLEQMIQKPTRVTSDSETLIDHIYTNRPENISEIQVPTYAISDHYPVCITRHAPSLEKKHNHLEIQYRDTSKFKDGEYLEDLKKEPFHLIDDINDCDNAVEMFYAFLNKAFNKHAPLKTKRVKQHSKPSWLSSDIKDAMYTRDRYHKQKDWENYKKWRNLVTEKIKKAKHEHYKQAIEENQKSSSIWKYLNELNSKAKPVPPSNIKYNDKTATTMQDIVDTFSQYFSSVYDNYQGSNEEYDPSVLDSNIKEKLENSPPLAFDFITEHDVYKTLDSLNVNKATGLDGIGPRILKLSAPIITKSVTHIINISIATNRYPDLLKHAKVTPILKKGARSNPENYRPISILPTLSKVIEKHIAKVIFSYLNAHMLIHKEQSGFRNAHSCQTALTKLTEVWLQEMDKGNLSGVVFLDFTKAFDLVNHAILTKKLQSYNFHWNSIEWIKSYLDNRTQKICIGTTSSKPELIKVGVPQGSVLGPLLFLIFINDLPLVTKFSNIDLFADDATLHSSGSSIDSIQTNLGDDIEDIHKWCKNNNMHLNINKTKCMLLTTAQRLSRMDKKEIDLNINGEKIDNVINHKLLGINIDHYLHWEEQIDLVYKKINSKLALLSKIKWYLTLDTRILYFNAYILPMFDYCVTIWGNCSKQNIQRISKLQKKAARIILNKPNDAPSKPLFDQLKWLEFEKRIMFQKCILMYKCLNGIAPIYLEEIFTYNEAGYSLRSCTDSKIQLPKPKLEIYKKSFHFSGPENLEQYPHTYQKQQILKIF